MTERRTFTTPSNWAAMRDTLALRARNRFTRQQGILQPAIEQAIGDWVESVRRSVTTVAALTADASPHPTTGPEDFITTTSDGFTLADADLIVARMLRHRDRFAVLLDRDVMPLYGRMLDEVLGRTTHDAQIGASLLDWRREWLAARRQVLVGVPDKITSITRTALATLASNNGTSVAQAQILVQTMLDRGYPQWTARAKTIARTETVASNNQGALTAWQSLASASGQTATKTWLATDDARTRDSHRELDGQTVAIDGTFDNGMNGPGDETGDAGEVVNCRCVAGDTIIDTLSIDYAARRWHEGQMVRLQSAGGHELAVTPNHPVLTPSGWVEAGHLRIGHQIITGNLSKRVTLPQPHVPQVSTSAAQFFDAFALADVQQRATRAGVDFHGDATHGEVEIAHPHYPLRFVQNASRDKHTTDRADADAVLGREELDAYAGQVFVDQLVTVERFAFAGHVYNFSTRQSAYIADGIVVHNCTLTYDFPDGEPEQMPDDMSSLTAAADTPEQVQEAINTSVAIMVGLGAGTESAIVTSPGVPEPEAPGLHCTVGYLAAQVTDLTDQQRDALHAALATEFSDGFTGTADAFAVAMFNPNSDEREPCAVVLVQSDWLNQVHQRVADVLAAQSLDQSTSFPIWIPHVAIGYNVGLDVVPDWLTGADSKVEFNRLVIGWGDEQIIAAGDGAQTPQPDGPEQTDAEQLTAATTEDDDVTAPPAPLTDDAPAVTEPPALNGQAEATGGDTGITDLTPKGPTWRGPLAKLGVPSSDGRIIDPTGGTIRTLPLPLWYQRESSHGGQPAGTTVRVGRVLSCDVQGDVLYGTGDWDLDVPETFEARSNVDDDMGMVSVDLGVTAVGFADDAGNPIDPALVDPGTAVNEVAIEWEFGGVTLVGFPAFDGVRITNDPEPEGATDEGALLPMPALDPGAFAAATPDPPTVADDGQSLTFPDGTTCGIGDPIAYNDDAGVQQTGTLSGIDAGAGTVTVTPAEPANGDDETGDPADPEPMTVPLTSLLPMTSGAAPTDDEGDGSMALLASSEVRPYSAKFFAQRELDGPTPLTVNPDTGEVYGHLATWTDPHVGKLMEGKTVHAPHSLRDYGDFHLSPVLMDDGNMIDVGRITVGTGHARPGVGHVGALAHYDDTGTQVAVVRAYEDKYGIQLTGQIIHDTPAAKVETLMRSPLSGDWRTRNGNLELCAALAVNVPGFPVRRLAPVVGQSKGNRQLSLVAAAVVQRSPRVRMPSGAMIDGDDYDALVASAVDALRRGGHVAPDRRAATKDEALAMRKARARLALR